MPETESQKITLTLDNSEKAKENEEKETKETIPENELLGVEDTRLSAEEKAMVADFAQKIDIMEANTILQYGSSAQNKIADFSEAALKNTQTKDLGEIGEMLTKLIGELRSFETEEKTGLFGGFFKRSANKIKSMKDRYDSAAANIEEITKALENHQIVLMKDIALLDQLYEKNLLNFKELSMYILAGQQRLAEIKEKELPVVLKKAAESKLPEDAQAANDLQNAIVRFEKKIHDLELTRVIAIQMAPQIRLVQNNDTLMVEKIQSTIVNTIPLWKSQMVIAMGIEHSGQAVKAQNEVSEMTNRMLKENAELLKSATVATAQETERGIVDIETLKETNLRLIETLDEVKRIQEEGRSKRAAAQRELRRIETEINRKLTVASDELKRNIQA